MWRIWPGRGLGFQGLDDETDEVLNDGYWANVHLRDIG